MTFKLLSLFSMIIILSCQGAGVKNSIVYTDYGSAGYKEKDNEKYFSLLKKANYKTADILFTCYTKDETSSKIDCDSYDSPKFANFSMLADKIKSKGFNLSLRVYVDLKNKKWRAYWDPANKEAAFLNLESVLVRFAKFANDKGAKSFLIGSEYEKLTRVKYKKQWQKIIQKIRKHYVGKVLYAANGNLNKKSKAEYEWVSFWDELDMMGINYYPPLKGKLTEVNLVRHHQSHIEKLKKFSKLKKKLLIFTEVGFPLAEKGIESPFEWRFKKKSKASAHKRDLSLETFLKISKEKKINGINIWRFYPDEKKVHPLGYIIDDNFLSLLKRY